MTAITGMSISGSMSVAMLARVTPPMITMSMASTTNVYGRFSAVRTIHMAGPPAESLNQLRPRGSELEICRDDLRGRRGQRNLRVAQFNDVTDTGSVSALG